MTDTTQEELPPLPECDTTPFYFSRHQMYEYARQCIATLKAELAQCQSDRQREHDARCTAAGSLEAAQSQAAAMAGLLEDARETK